GQHIIVWDSVPAEVGWPTPGCADLTDRRQHTTPADRSRRGWCSSLSEPWTSTEPRVLADDAGPESADSPSIPAQGHRSDDQEDGFETVRVDDRVRAAGDQR